MKINTSVRPRNTTSFRTFLIETGGHLSSLIKSQNRHKAFAALPLDDGVLKWFVVYQFFECHH